MEDLMITYAELSKSMQDYLGFKLSGSSLVFLIFMAAAFAVLILAYILHLVKQYKELKQTTDTFDYEVKYIKKKEVDNSGYHQGIFRDDSSTKFEKKDDILKRIKK